MRDRLRRIEQRLTLDRPRRWVRILWQPGQRLTDALRGTKPTDSLIIRRIIDVKDGRPVPDPVHEADRVFLNERMLIDG